MGKICSSSKRTKKESPEKALPPWNPTQVKGYLYISVSNNVKAEEKLKNLSHDLRACIEAIYQLYGIYDFCIELFGTKIDVECAISDLIEEFKPLSIKKHFADADECSMQIYSYSAEGLIKYCGIPVGAEQQKCHFHKFNKQTFIPFIIQVSPSHGEKSITDNVIHDIMKKALSMNNADDIIYTVAFNKYSAHFMLVVRCNEYYKLNEITKLMDEVVDAKELRKITYPIAGIIHYDVNETGIKWAWNDRERVLKNSEIHDAMALLDDLAKAESAPLKKYQIVGNYVLHNKELSGELLKIKNEVESFISKGNRDYRYLCTLHGESRNGKSFFVEELGRILYDQMKVDYKKIDLGKNDERDLELFLKERKLSLANKNKVFCFIDEIDTPGKEFAFHKLFNIIRDWGTDDKCPIIWFLTGSNGSNFTEFLKKIEDTYADKAKDFVKRIEEGTMIEIPSPSISDKIIVACHAAKMRGFKLAEKHILFYIATQKKTLQDINKALIKIRNEKGEEEPTLKSGFIGNDEYKLFENKYKKLLHSWKNDKIRLTDDA